MDEKLDECITLMQDNSEKTQKVISELQKERTDNKNKSRIIKWLCAVIMVGIISAAIVAGIFVYGYMYSPYAYGSVNQSQTSGDSGVQIVGGVN